MHDIWIVLIEGVQSAALYGVRLDGESELSTIDQILQNIDVMFSDDFLLRFIGQNLGTLTQKVVEKVSREVNGNLLRVPGIDAAKLIGRGKIDGIIRENLSLIKRGTQQEVAKLQKIYDENRGLSSRELAKLIEAETSVSKKRARFWARDQTLKMHADITETRHREIGIEEYIWTDSGNANVRESHKELNGQKFSYANPPVVNDRGDRKNPGKDYNCKCTAYPVFEGAEILDERQI